MGQVVTFPTPLPTFTDPQDVGRLYDYLNSIIDYINSITYGTNIPATVLLKSNNLSDVASVSASRTNLGLGTAATHAATDFDAAGAAAAAQAAAIAASDPAGSAAAAQAAAEAASDPAGTAAAVGATKANKGINSDITALTALKISSKTSAYQISPGDNLIEVDATGGAVTITYKSSTAAGQVRIVKTDASYNPVNLSDGTTGATNVKFSLVAPASGNYFQSAIVYRTTAGGLRVTA